MLWFSRRSRWSMALLVEEPGPGCVLELRLQLLVIRDRSRQRHGGLLVRQRSDGTLVESQKGLDARHSGRVVGGQFLVDHIHRRMIGEEGVEACLGVPGE